MLEWESFYLSLPSEVLKLVKQKGEELGWTDQAVICDAVERYFNWKEVREEMVYIEIPKSLYDQIDKFAVVEKAVVSDMTEWVEIMEDESNRKDEEMVNGWFK